VSNQIRLFVLKYLAAVVVGTLIFAAPTSSFAKSKKPFGTEAILALEQEGSVTIRSKGVASVTNPATGEYCVTPSSKLDFSAIYPVVTIDWGASSGTQLLAFWDSNDNGCSSAEIEVRTYDFSSGTPILFDHVAFVLTVQ
jgi:hypothetical protein